VFSYLVLQHGGISIKLLKNKTK